MNSTANLKQNSQHRKRKSKTDNKIMSENSSIARISATVKKQHTGKLSSKNTAQMLVAGGPHQQSFKHDGSISSPRAAAEEGPIDSEK